MVSISSKNNHLAPNFLPCKETISISSINLSASSKNKSKSVCIDWSFVWVWLVEDCSEVLPWKENEHLLVSPFCDRFLLGDTNPSHKKVSLFLVFSNGIQKLIQNVHNMNLERYIISNGYKFLTCRYFFYEYDLTVRTANTTTERAITA